MINDKVYDILKLIATLIAPAVTFISALLIIWNVPYTEQITASLAALTTLINALVAIFKAKYDKAQRLTSESN